MENLQTKLQELKTEIQELKETAKGEALNEALVRMEKMIYDFEAGNREDSDDKEFLKSLEQFNRNN